MLAPQVIVLEAESATLLDGLGHAELYSRRNNIKNSPNPFATNEVKELRFPASALPWGHMGGAHEVHGCTPLGA